MKKLFKNKKGFTLVELMVVVAIMGILVAVAVPVYNNATEKARINTCQTNCRTIESAMMTYATSEAVTVTADTWKSKDAAALKAALVPAYLKEFPVCPTKDADGKAYTYKTDATGKVICSDPTHAKDYVKP